MESEKKFALLIDADNISPKFIDVVMKETAVLGVATFRRIYADWTDNSKESWKKVLLENSLTPIQQYSYTYGKNSSDSAMIIDAMDILYTGDVDGFILVTSDSDFTKLAIRLREAGKQVIGMGESKTPAPFVKACVQFKTLDVLVKSKNKKSRSAQNKAKAEAAKAEAARAEALRQEELKAEALRQEELKAEAARLEAAKAEESRHAEKTAADAEQKPESAVQTTAAEKSAEEAPAANAAASEKAEPAKKSRRRRKSDSTKKGLAAVISEVSEMVRPDAAKNAAKKENASDKKAKAENTAAELAETAGLAAENTESAVETAEHENDNSITGLEEILALVASTLEEQSDDDGWMFLGDIGNMVLRSYPEFDPRNYGYKKIKDIFTGLPEYEVRSEVSSNGRTRLVYVRLVP